ncbi:MAG: hypothetical protein ABH857_04655 [Elusimicrobiota bacterium]
MRRLFVILQLLLLSIIFSSCGKNNNQNLNPVPHYKRVKVVDIKSLDTKYTYNGRNYIDPLKPLIDDGRIIAPEVHGTINAVLPMLSLTGIISDGENKYAILSDGKGHKYYVKDGKVMDPAGSILTGVSGVIKEDNVLIITRQGVRKITMRK